MSQAKPRSSLPEVHRVRNRHVHSTSNDNWAVMCMCQSDLNIGNRVGSLVPRPLSAFGLHALKRSRSLETRVCVGKMSKTGNEAIGSSGYLT